jgi:hypothetical protein
VKSGIVEDAMVRKGMADRESSPVTVLWRQSSDLLPERRIDAIVDGCALVT